MRYASRKVYEWSSDLAYFTGLMSSDGCLSNDGRHLIIVSKDLEIIEHVQFILSTHYKIGIKTGGFQMEAYFLQFSDVSLYDFLLSVGLTPAKSLTIRALSVPDKYYADFLRGHFDGDGSAYGYQDRRWSNSFMYYTQFISASLPFLEWLRLQNCRLALTSQGAIHHGARADVLSYAKKDSRLLFAFMYHRTGLPKLSRKHDKLVDFLQSDPYNKLLDARVL